MDFTHIKFITNTLGLFFGLVGSLLLWKFGLSPSISKEGFIVKVAEQQDEAEMEKWKRYDCWSKTGI